MNARRFEHAKAAHGFVHDTFAFLVSERFKRLVLEPHHRVSFVVIAHPALECGVTSGRGLLQRRAVRFRRQR